MDVRECVNYGKGFGELVADPHIAKRLRKILLMPMLRMLWREVGPLGLVKVAQRTSKEVRRMKDYDWSVLRRHGLRSERLIDLIVQNTASVKVLADMVGMERAKAALRQLMQETAYEGVTAMFQPIERFLECEDYFASFKEYFKAHNEATAREGALEVRMKEDTDAALAFDVTYCAWHEIAVAFGDPELCYPSCYSDEVFFPKAGAQLGFRFTRIGTLSSGAPACDFRLHRV